MIIRHQTLPLQVGEIAVQDAEHFVAENARTTKEIKKEQVVVKTSCSTNRRVTHYASILSFHLQQAAAIVSFSGVSAVNSR